MSLFYDFNGMRHEISHEEVEAIERSGRSEWRHYRDFPDEDEFHPTAWAKIAAMESRPGATFQKAAHRDTGSDRPGYSMVGMLSANRRRGPIPLLTLLRKKQLKVHMVGSNCPSMSKGLVPDDMILSRRAFLAAHNALQCLKCIDKAVGSRNVSAASLYVMAVHR